MSRLVLLLLGTGLFALAWAAPASADGDPAVPASSAISADPTLVGTLGGGPRDARDVFVSGGFAYVADFQSGLRIVDVSDPTDPVEVGLLDTPDTAYGVFVSADLVFVADQDSGLRVVDLSTPSAPVEVGLDTFGLAWDVFVSGDLAFLPAGVGGLRIVDVSTPSAPVEAGSLALPSDALDVFVAGGLAYVADAAGLRIVDVFTPTAPVGMSFLDAPDRTSAVFVSGDLVYMAVVDDGHGGLLVVDPGVSVTNRVVLQMRSDHSAATVTATGPGFESTVPVAPDGSFEIPDVPDGTYTLSASAPGYLSAQVTGVLVADGEIAVPATELRAGDVDGNDFVNINDITAIVASFGTVVTDCVDALGRFVDLDCNGFVKINDITGAVSNFGKGSPQPW
ncbi:MAG: carboxypeptidase regulatory-like domain-containing protein [Dehalococcoidia bacterium]